MPADTLYKIEAVKNKKKKRVNIDKETRRPKSWNEEGTVELDLMKEISWPCKAIPSRFCGKRFPSHLWRVRAPLWLHTDIHRKGHHFCFNNSCREHLQSLIEKRKDVIPFNWGYFFLYMIYLRLLPLTLHCIKCILWCWVTWRWLHAVRRKEWVKNWFLWSITRLLAFRD
jgi:hypothetical protein